MPKAYTLIHHSKEKVTVILKQTAFVSLHPIYDFITVYLKPFSSHVRWEYIPRINVAEAKIRRKFSIFQRQVEVRKAGGR